MSRAPARSARRERRNPPRPHKGPGAPTRRDALPRFLARFEEVYSNLGKSETILATAAAHHRLAWIHPFLDGSGRVMRLMSYATLLNTLDTGGIWSVARRLARDVEEYKHRRLRYTSPSRPNSPRAGCRACSPNSGREHLRKRHVAASYRARDRSRMAETRPCRRHRIPPTHRGCARLASVRALIGLREEAVSALVGIKRS